MPLPVVCWLSVALIVAAPLAAEAAAPDATALSTKGGCIACHTPDTKRIGPTYQEIAARYKGRANALAQVTGSVRKGSKGVWGPVAMPPTPPAKLGDAELKALLGAILR